MSVRLDKDNTPEADGTVEVQEDTSEKLDRDLVDLLGADKKEDDDTFPMVSDMSDRFPDGVSVVRAELRRVHDPATGPVPPIKRVVEDAYVIGFVLEEDLPEDGEVFHFYYHNYDGVLKFGHLSSFHPVHDVVKDGDNIFFSNTGANWRLTVLNVGN